MGSMECSGVLFDLDGVLVDSTPCVARVWRGWAIEHGFDPAEVIRLAHGRRAIETVEMLAPHLDSAAELRELERRELDDTEGLVRIEGGDRLLASLPPDRWAVVTSGTRRLAEKRLRIAGLPLPEKMVSADEVKLGKPDPAPFLRGAQLLGVGPAQCIAVEDAPSGIVAAHRAGMRVLAVPTTYPRAELSEADVLLESLAQLQASTIPNSGAGNLIQLRW
ncbi:MAG: HAD family hydrolase [Candidatus Korobacteraceae bacterium]